MTQPPYSFYNWEGWVHLIILQNMAMQDRERGILRKLHMSFIDEILNPELVVFKLKQRGIFSEFCFQIVCVQPTQIQKVSKLMCLLPTKGAAAFSVFIDILKEDYPLLAKKIGVVCNQHSSM